MSDKIEINLKEITTYIKKYFYISILCLILAIFISLRPPSNLPKETQLIYKANIKYNQIDALAFQDLSNHFENLNQIYYSCNQLEIFFDPKFDNINNQIQISVLEKLMRLYTTCSFFFNESKTSDEALFFKTFEKMARNKIVNNLEIKITKNADFGEIAVSIETKKEEDLYNYISFLENTEGEFLSMVKDDLTDININLSVIDSYAKTIPDNFIDLVIFRSSIDHAIESYNEINNNINFENIIAKKTLIEDNVNTDLPIKERSLFESLFFGIIIGLLFGILISITLGYLFKNIEFIK